MFQLDWFALIARVHSSQGVILLCGLAAVAGSVLVSVVMRRLAREHGWLPASASLPLHIGIWGAAALLPLSRVLDFALLLPLQALVVTMVWLVSVRAASGVKHWCSEAACSASDRVLMLQLARTLDAVVLSLGAALLLPLFGVSATAAMLLLSAVLLGGLWLTRDVLRNAISGFDLQRSCLLRRGDQLSLAEPAIDAVVETIGLTHTGLRTEDDQLLWLPNAILAQQWLINASPRSQRRIHEHLGIRLEDIDILREIVDEGERMLRHHEEVLQDKTLVVSFDRFTDSAAEILVSCFVSPVEPELYHACRQDILLRLHDIIAGHGAELARPSRVVNVEANIRKLRGFAEDMVA